MNLLISLYDEEVKVGRLIADLEQRAVLMALEKIVTSLSNDPSRVFWRRKKKKIKGLYLYGCVGAGKTYLMDLFFNHTPVKAKKRVHFHHFMQVVDHFLRSHQGQKDPLLLFAREFAKETRLLCFDEFIVHDIAHAMILANLLSALFDEGVVLVATSNLSPDQLYLDGLQRVRFLPAIELIKQNCTIIGLNSSNDYRQIAHAYQQSFYILAEDPQYEKMKKQFDLFGEHLSEDGFLSIQQRSIHYRYKTQHAIWFQFNELCQIPRSQLDYLEIAEKYKAIFVSQLPQLLPTHLPQIMLFMYLVDVVYDAKILLVISSEMPLTQLESILAFMPTFQRTLSRLQEMQTDYYHAQCQ